MKHIIATEGYWLTQANDTEDRIFFQEAYLGVNDSEDNYSEWSDDAKNEWEEIHNNLEG